MSDSQRTPESGAWHMPRYKRGEDDLWDGLGEDWQAVDGVHPGLRVYVRFDAEAPGRPQISGLCLGGQHITTDALRAIPISRLENLPALLKDAQSRDQFLSELVPLVRRKGDDPEEFSSRVAMYYRIFAATSSKPAKEIAEHAGVPVATVRGWIREARLRGKLPPGTRGKAG